MSYLRKRGNNYHFRRRVPKSYQEFFPKDVVQVPLDTDSKNVALQRASSFNLLLEDFWSDLSQLGLSEAETKFHRAVLLCRMSGYQYKVQSEIVEQSSPAELIGRISRAHATDDEETAIALLGGVPRPKLMLKEVFKAFFKHEAGNISGLSPDQVRKWKNPRQKAFKNFIKVVGNKAVDEINREDLLSFREWWVEKIKTQDMTANSANKNFGHLKKALSVVSDNYDLKLPIEALFKKLYLKEVEKTRRYPFTTKFIQEKLFGCPVAEMNLECRMLLFAMADTGARISELTGLEEGDVFLHSSIPHIKIRPNALRSLKTPQSERDIPLVGTSLYAFQQLEGPFQRYSGKHDLISTTINKFCRENNIFPSKNHSLYSLRHSFEDRLTAVEPPDKVQAALMGHKYIRPRYGHGPTLEQKKLWLDKIAFKIQ